jgi:hypothetical protein
MEKRLVETMDCTPTWSGILPLYLSILEDNSSKQNAKDSARAEIKRMATIADAYNDTRKHLKEVSDQSVETISTLLKLIDHPDKATQPQNKKILDEIRQLVKEHYEAKATANSDQGLVNEAN